MSVSSTCYIVIRIVFYNVLYEQVFSTVLIAGIKFCRLRLV